MEKDVEIEWKGEKKIVRIKRLSFGDMNELREKASDVKMIGGQPVVKLSQKILMEQSLVKGIVDAPFTVDITSIQALDNETGTKLYGEFVELNRLDEKKPTELIP